MVRLRSCDGSSGSVRFFVCSSACRFINWFPKLERERERERERVRE